MSLLKMKLKAAVLMGIAGVLVFGGGAWAAMNDACPLDPSDPTTLDGFLNEDDDCTELENIATPDATIDYVNEMLEGLDDGDAEKYLINGDEVTLSSGKVDVDAGWFGTDVEIVAVGVSTTHNNSNAQTLSIPARPATPSASTFTVTKVSAAGLSDGKISGITALMEYRQSSSTGSWTAGNGSDVTGLATGVYHVRVRAVASTSFASLPVSVTVGVEGQANPATGYTLAGAGGATTITVNAATLLVTATPTPSGADDEALTWTTSDAAIATVAATTTGAKTATVTAVGNGSVTIKAKGNDSNKDGALVLTISGQGGGQGGSGAEIVLSIGSNPSAFDQYAGNINSRVALESAAVLRAGDSVDATKLNIQWYKTTLTSLDPGGTNVVYTGADKNASLVQDKFANGDGTFYVLPLTLPSKVGGTADSLHYYFARATVTSNKGTKLEKFSSVYTVTVKPRPVIVVKTVSASTSISTGKGTSANLVINATLNNPYGPGAVAPLTKAFPTVEWYLTNKDGVEIEEANNSGSATGPGTPNTNDSSYTYPLGTGLGVGYYYFRATATYANAATVKSDVFSVTVTPVGMVDTTILASTASINVKDTVIVFRVTSPITKSSTTASGTSYTSNNSGDKEKLRVSIPTTSGSLVSGGTAQYSYRVRDIYYTKVAPVTCGGSAYTLPCGFKAEDMDALSPPTTGFASEATAKNYNHGVEAAGTYSVKLVIVGTHATLPPQIATKYVRLTVQPKPLSSIAATGITVKGQPGDTVYDGSSKTPWVEIKDVNGSLSYTLTTDDFVVRPPLDPNSWINAGSAPVQVYGKAALNQATWSVAEGVDGNYTGDLVKSYTIRKRPITVNAARTSVSDKLYDGTDTIAASNIRVYIDDIVARGELDQDKGDIIVSGQRFDNKDVGLRTLNNITVKLDTVNSVKTRNYTFGAVNAAPVITTTFNKAGVNINKSEPVEAFLSFNIDTTHLYNAKPRGIGTVSWKTGVTNPSGTLEVIYAKGTEPWAKALPVDEGTYGVAVRVTGGSNFIDNTVYLEKQYVIHAPKNLTVETKPAIKTGSGETQDTIVYLGQSLQLSAKGVRPDSTKTPVLDADGLAVQNAAGSGDSVIVNYYKGGTISYQWYKVYTDPATSTPFDSILKGATAETYKLPLPLKEGTETFKVKVKWTYDAVQVPDSVYRSIVVLVGPEPASLADAEITVNGSFVYDGKRKEIVDENLTVTVGNESLVPRTHFTYEYFGLNAGVKAGTVTITGIGAYKGTKIGYFDIDKITTDESVLSFGTTTQYNDSTQEFSVTAKGGLLGLGTVTKKYFTVDEDGKETALTGAPKAVGDYLVKVTIAEGLNFTAMEEFEKPYSIVKRALTKNDFTYTLPEEHAYTGVAKPAVTATLKSTVKGFTGTTGVVYFLGNTRLEEMPVDEGTYEVMVEVVGDDNFNTTMVVLGNYVIHDAEWVGVKGGDRVIPTKPVVEEAAVAPVKVVASSFTAGPSPVSKGGVIKFFSTKTVKSGSLYIFDKNGNSVAKLAAKSGTGEIGKWTANISEGTYVVKGALVGKDGTREKVSFVFVVVR